MEPPPPSPADEETAIRDEKPPNRPSRPTTRRSAAVAAAAAAAAAAPPPSFLEIRLFYVRVSPCAPDSVPPHLNLSHLRDNGVIVEINGCRVPPSDPTSLPLRRDRVDRDASEVTYLSTDGVRISGAAGIEISDDRGNLILSGALQQANADTAGLSCYRDPMTGWCMSCSIASSIGSSAFVQHKAGISVPSIEVYVAGCFGGSPLILTQTLQYTPKRKAARMGNLDGEISGKELKTDEGLHRHKRSSSSSSSMDDGEETMDFSEIQKAGLSVIAVCVTFMLDFLRRKEIKEILPREPTQYKSMCRDMRRKAYMQKIMAGRDSCIDFIRMDRPAFFRLVEIMRERTLLRDTRHVSIEEQLAMGLHILGHNSSNRAMKTDFIRSGETISRYFNLVLGAICSIRDDFVKQPGPEAHPDIANNPSYYPWFKDCVGLVDVNHIEATVPAEIASRFQGGKDRPTQNVLAAITFDRKFCYVVAGWEGSANELTILKDALSLPHPDGLQVNEGKYYLLDSAFMTMPGFIAPYPSVRYHLKEHAVCTPANSKELFNLRHSSLRSKAKSAFDILKNRFKILCTHPSFPFPTQVDIVLACCVIHNYILGVDLNDKFLNDEIEVAGDEEDDFQLLAQARAQHEQREENREWVELRDRIAEDMWLDYNRPNWL